MTLHGGYLINLFELFQYFGGGWFAAHQGR